MRVMGMSVVHGALGTCKVYVCVACIGSALGMSCMWQALCEMLGAAGRELARVERIRRGAYREQLRSLLLHGQVNGEEAMPTEHRMKVMDLIDRLE